MTIVATKSRTSKHWMLLCALLIPVVAFIAATQIPALYNDPALLTSASPEGDGTTPGYRNERSTPRVSVLPASPAIADVLERSDVRHSVSMAKAMLLGLGYPVGRLDERVTAKFKAAVFRYQRVHGIPASGNLDETTLRSLGLISK